jgi:FkbM family methyltransferase
MGYDIYETERGRFLLTTDNDLVSDQIKAGQFWEHELEPVFDRITGDMQVVEVGAYVGDHTVDLAKRCSYVYAFEGKRSSYYQLCANLLLNSCPNVTPYWMCVGAENGLLEGYTPDPGNIAAHKYVEGGTVIVQTLDDVLSDIPRLDFLKIDVEGMDLEVMMGAKGLIDKFKPMIAYEFSWPLSKQNHEEYVQFLEELGYKTVKLSGEWNWLAEYDR